MPEAKEVTPKTLREDAMTFYDEADAARRKAKRAMGLANALDDLDYASRQVNDATQRIAHAARCTPLSRDELVAVAERGKSLEAASEGLKSFVVRHMVDILVDSLSERLGALMSESSRKLK